MGLGWVGSWEGVFAGYECVAWLVGRYHKVYDSDLEREVYMCDTTGVDMISGTVRCRRVDRRLLRDI